MGLQVRGICTTFVMNYPIMIQEILTYIVLLASLCYLFFRFFRKKTKNCAACSGSCSKIEVEKIVAENAVLKNKN